MAWEDGGNGGTKQAVVGAGEEEGGSEAGVGDAIAVAARDALDHPVEA